MNDLAYYATALRLPPELISTTEGLIKDPAFGAVFREALAGRFEKAFGAKPLWQAALCLCLMPTTHEVYRQRGIPDEVFFDTMTDVELWILDYRAKHGKLGLCEIGFLYHHFKLEIFRLGRLEFEPTTFNQHINGCPVKYGEQVLNVHIPAGAPLNTAECIKSFAAAMPFFNRYTNIGECRYFVCDSWILYPDNKLFVGEDSNIAKFIDLFTVVKTIACPDQAYERIFGNELCPSLRKRIKQFWTNKPYNFDSLPQNTSLQRNAKKYLAQGGAMGLGIAIRKI